MIFIILILFQYLFAFSFCGEQEGAISPLPSFPSSIDNVESLIEIDNFIYKRVIEAKSQMNFTKRQKDILNEYTAEYDKTPARFRGTKFQGYHPFLLYGLVRRYSRLPTTLLSPLYEELTKIWTSYGFGWPDLYDLHESIDSIIRLHDFYDMDVNMLRYGKFTHKTAKNEFTYKLNARDCLQIGQRAIQTKHYAVGIEWMEMAHKILLEENDDRTTTLPIIEAHLSDAILTHDMVHNSTHGEQMYLYEDLLLDSNLRPHGLEIKPRKVKSFVYQPVKGFVPKSSDKEGMKANYMALCKGEDLLPDERKPALFCTYSQGFYFTEKIEYLSIVPQIVKIYDVFGDEALEYLKTIPGVKNKLRYSPEELMGGAHFALEAYLKNFTNPRLLKISKRISYVTRVINYDITPENSTFDSGLQLSVYPPGSQFPIHQDMVNKVDNETYNTHNSGDRLTTILIYLTDTEAGGDTVFVQALVSSRPTKGAGLFWFNLHRNGRYRTDIYHAALKLGLSETLHLRYVLLGLNLRHSISIGCPVVAGRKFVLIKLTNYSGQETTYPCTLNRSD